ncbi:MAG: M67 family metallopeptidase [Candidatus Aquicultorales bacterium]
MLKTVTLEKTLYGEMVAECIAAAPREACGLLFGSDGFAEKAVALANVADDPERRYLIDPAEQFAAFKAMRAEGRELVGTYHSHPATEAYPSKTDKELAFYPESYYLILSLADGVRARAFSIVDGEVEELAVAIENADRRAGRTSVLSDTSRDRGI